MSGRKQIKRKPANGRPRRNPDHDAWLAYVNAGTLKNIALVAAAGAGIVWIFGNIVQPVYDSGPLPVPSRAEVDKLRVETTATLDGLNKSVATTLEVAKAARTEAQQAVQGSNDARIRRLTQQKLQLEATLKMMPGDAIFTDLLAQTTRELAVLSNAPTTTLPQVSLPVTETK